MSQPIRKSLLRALQHQDFEGFRSIIRSCGLPRDSTFLDYELLTKACKLGCKRIANLLLDNGARVFKKPGLFTPLHRALAKGDGWTRMVERLLEKGARVGDKNSQGETPLHVAFARGASGKLVDYLLKKHLEDDGENVVNKERLSFLHIACTRPDVDVVAKLAGTMSNEKLFHHQVSPLSDSRFAGYTPIHFAVAHGNHQVADYLLECSPDLVYSADVEQSSPLHLALEKRDVEMIDLILSHDKFGCVCTNKNGLSHLMASCVGTNAATVKNYLRSAKERYSTCKSSSLVNSRVKNSNVFGGYTPLHFAAEFGNVDAIETLLLEGADCCATNHRGLTVHEVAEDNVRELLHSHCRVFKDCKGLLDDTRYEFADLNGNYKVDFTLDNLRKDEFLIYL